MPFVDAEARRAYERTYHLARYRRLRLKWVAALGGKCRDCGATEDLQLDHKDRTKKSFTVSTFWGLPVVEIQKELKKCQILCRSCHKKKTSSELRGGHGTWGMYRNRKCRCSECRAFVSAYHKKRKIIGA